MKNSLIEIITNKINIEDNIKDVSIIDLIKFKFNFKKIKKIMRNYSTNNSNEIEQYIIDLNLSKYLKIINLIDQTSFDNLLLNIYFILGNPYSIDSNDFTKLAEDDTNIIIKSGIYIILTLEKMIETDDLYKFYNQEILERWIKSIINKPVTKEEYYTVSKLSDKEKSIRWKQYINVYKLYNYSSKLVKKYLLILHKFYIANEVTNPGCYTLSCNISNDLYIYFIELHTGLKVDINMLKNLEKWAVKELDNLVTNMKKILQTIEPKADISKSHIELLKLYTNSQKFKSKEEFVDHHKEKIKKYRDIFINKYKFKEYTKLNLIIFDNKHLAGGYYYENNFYLNSAYWKDAYKYNTESLILHEAYPGHHLQCHLYKHMNRPNNLLYAYFPTVINGFVEGWGLFAETLGSDQSNWDKIGMIEYDIFRTLRIIVDIRIHTKDYTPKQICDYVKQYLNFSEEEINNEIYRYIVYPGQAVSYKIGSEVFKKIINKKLLTPNELIEKCKEIISSETLPLSFLLKKYNIDINEIF